MELVSLFDVDWDERLIHSGNHGNDRGGLEEKHGKPTTSFTFQIRSGFLSK
jgi:hypothetical protein